MNPIVDGNNNADEVEGFSCYRVLNFYVKRCEIYFLFLLGQLSLSAREIARLWLIPVVLESACRANR